MGIEVPFSLDLAVGVQTARGSINDTIRDLAGPLSTADGLVSGDPATGIGESGVTLKLTREFEANALLANLTEQPSQFLAMLLENLTLAWRLKGNGVALPAVPAAADYLPVPGVLALLKGFSLGQDVAIDPPYRLVPAPITYLTVKVWLGNTVPGQTLVWVGQDCVASGSILWTPKLVGVATATLEVGSVAKNFAGLEVARPSFDYGTQTTQAPIVKGAGYAWPDAGPPVVRPFEVLRLDFANGVTRRPDSNADNGERLSHSARPINTQYTVYADQTQLAFELDELQRATPPVDGWSFRVGDPAGSIGELPLGYTLRMDTPEVRDVTPVRLDDLFGWQVNAAAVATAPNGGFYLEFD